MNASIPTGKSMRAKEWTVRLHHVSLQEHAKISEKTGLRESNLVKIISLVHRKWWFRMTASETLSELCPLYLLACIVRSDERRTHYVDCGEMWWLRISSSSKANRKLFPKKKIIKGTTDWIIHISFHSSLERHLSFLSHQTRCQGQKDKGLQLLICQKITHSKFIRNSSCFCWTFYALPEAQYTEYLF